MKVSDIRAYLANANIQDTDNFVILTADGTAHAISSIVRNGGTQNVDPPNPPADVPAQVTVQLA